MEKEKSNADRLVIRNLKEDEIDKAESLVRLAFGTFLNIPDPLQNPAKRRMIAHRFFQNPQNVIRGFIDGELVGINVLSIWGSFAFFGPLAVRPDLWDSGVGSKLVDYSVRIFEKLGIVNLGLFTFADSPKHLGLYHKFGFHSRFLTPLMEKKIDVRGDETKFDKFSSLDASERKIVLNEIRDLTNELHQGLDLSSEIELVDKFELGDTILLYRRQSELVGFGVCQYGENTEAGLDRCYVKFGASRSGLDSAKYFDELLSACESISARFKANTLEAGVNLSNDDSFDIMLKRGFQVLFVGVAMQKPNEPAFLRSGNFVMSDWR